MRQANLISALVLLIASVLFWFWVIPAQIGESQGEEVSPRLLPYICVLGIGVLSIFLLVNNWRAKGNEQASPISWAEARAFAVIGSLLAIGIGVFMYLGALAATLFIVWGILLAMGERRPLPLLLIPGVLLLGAYLLFYKVLGTAIA